MVTDAYTKSGTWVLRAPDARLHLFNDLKGFVKGNAHLFHPRDVIWSYSSDGGNEWCPAYTALSRLHPNFSAKLKEWKGWTWFGDELDPSAATGEVPPPAQPTPQAPKVDYKQRHPVQRGPSERLCTAREVSELLNIPLSSVYHLRKTGQLQVIRIGGRYRFERSKVLAIRDGTADIPTSDELGYKHAVNEMISRTSKLLRELRILGRDYDKLIENHGTNLSKFHAL